MEVSAQSDGKTIQRVGVIRTARRIMDGKYLYSGRVEESIMEKKNKMNDITKLSSQCCWAPLWGLL